MEQLAAVRLDQLPDALWPHDLRHTCATIQAMKGQHPQRVQELLGHTSIAMTMDVYSHIIPEMSDDNGIMDDL